MPSLRQPSFELCESTYIHHCAFHKWHVDLNDVHGWRLSQFGWYPVHLVVFLWFFFIYILFSVLFFYYFHLSNTSFDLSHCAIQPVYIYFSMTFVFANFKAEWVQASYKAAFIILRNFIRVLKTLLSSMSLEKKLILPGLEQMHLTLSKLVNKLVENKALQKRK